MRTRKRRVRCPKCGRLADRERRETKHGTAWDEYFHETKLVTVAGITFREILDYCSVAISRHKGREL